MMQNDLFSSITPVMEKLAEGVFLFRDYVDTEYFYTQIQDIFKQAPLRHMITPGGKRINVSGTSIGKAGWYSDRKGYRYEMIDPVSQKAWPAIPQRFMEIANKAAARAGFEKFLPDSCFINCYEPGTRLTSHQDQDEKDFSQPIVSVSLGVTAIFQLYGDQRGGTPMNIPLHNGDLLIFGGIARRYFHSVKKLEKENHPLTGDRRFNLTFRKAL